MSDFEKELTSALGRQRTHIPTRLRERPLSPGRTHERLESLKKEDRWEPRTDPVAGLTRYAPRAATFSLLNVGLGEALDLRCYVVEPVSGRYQYFRFKEGFPLFCPGDAANEAYTRVREYPRLLRPQEEQEVCLTGFDLSPTFEGFLAVQCSYRDKEGNEKGGDVLEIPLGGGFWVTNEEERPAHELIDQFRHGDDRVLRVLRQTPAPSPFRLPTP